ncbi:MAG: pyruvate kinase [bacterium]
MPAPPGDDRRRTKIVTTIGPVSHSVETMTRLIEAGADVFRLNFSHGTADEHAENVVRAREAADSAGREIGLLGDLPGPKLRLGTLAAGVVELAPDSETELTTGETKGDAGHLPVSWAGLPEAVSEGDAVYLADGRIRLRVLGKDSDSVRCAVEAGGRVASHQGLNLPGSEVSLPAARREDLEWVDFAISHDIDLLAISFVRRAEDILPVERRIRTAGSDIPVIAKIEKPQAAERSGEIIAATTAGIMVARGDLGIELPIEQVPTVQRRLLRLAGNHARPSITATQMLASMVSSPRPTRAEVSDVSAAILQGTDAVMLSEETAVGDYPVEAVAVMDRIARATEPDLPYDHWLFNRVVTDADDVAGSVARAAVGSTYNLGLAAIVVPTRSGRTARLVSAQRPRMPVLAVSPRRETVRRLQVLFGVSCVLADDWEGLTALLDDCARFAKETGVAKSGELIGITAGMPEQELGTNLFEIHRVP